ncbi:hypothetical protein M405DRAFT_864811 [Rhizopogon salebrosus TDB-379]|nr:hypothetical protein M405DRAFT_864811 [Rhizopogon salebrosus TDB-379]
MSMPLPGTYRLRNVKYPNQLFDLSGGSANAGTPVVGYANNSNSQNMLWTMQVVDANNKAVRLLNVASGTFAQGASSQSGAGVVGNPGPALMMIAPRNNLGEYSIQTTDGRMACTLANANNFTQVTLQNASANDNSQGWIFCPV